MMGLNSIRKSVTFISEILMEYARFTNTGITDNDVLE